MKPLMDNPKPPFQLFRKKGDETAPLVTTAGAEVWVCGECGVLSSSQYGDLSTQERAARCCKQEYCACGNKIEAYYSGPKCSSCNSFDRTQARLAKAQEIETCDGPVYDDDRDRYWSDLGEFEDWARDHIEDGEEDSLPDWIYPCSVKGFARQDAGDLLESYLEDQHHEDAHEHLVDLSGLQKYLDKWCKKQTLQSWEADFSRKIRVQKLIPPTETAETRKDNDG